ncbi:MAG: putative DNA binding domain-containing protein [Candidatus Tectomicrobia bacterium]|nr:putative DNA binding domain-containing protein [Candidatus Tectomicrobia bacterium]
MNATELAEFIHLGENSGIEFKRDDVTPAGLAKEMAALLNLEGGHIFLGVEKDRSVSGLTREREQAEEWVMEVARSHLRPAAIPFWETLDCGEGKTVGVISLPADAPDKPYKCRRGSAWVTQIRAGTTSRDATDEEESRLYMQSGRLQYDRKPVPGADLHDFDMRRLVNYFRDVRRQSCPSLRELEDWTRLLINTELMYEDRGRTLPSAGGLLLFGSRPKRYLPQSGISAAAYTGTEKDYDARERAVLGGALVSLFPERLGEMGRTYPGLPPTFSDAGSTVESGIIEQAMEFVRRNITIAASIDNGGRRQDRWDYPMEAVREAIVNAVAHRDYTISVMDIELSIYADRLEIISPGRLPNTVTVDKMRAGYRASRNELIKEVLRDYGYVEATGLGVPRKIVAGMRQHNGTEPDLVEEESRFIVRLWKRPQDIV